MICDGDESGVELPSHQGTISRPFLESLISGNWLDPPASNFIPPALCFRSHKRSVCPSSSASRLSKRSANRARVLPAAPKAEC
jgi:hypothetical protein